jgi:hypothetical protein
MSIIFPFIEEYKPDFIFAGFCGAETTLFLNEFIKRGFHHKIKVLGLPYLLAPFAPLDEDITIYTTLPFENAPEISSSKVFYHLGQQTGEAISKAIVKANSKSELRDQMAALDVFFNVGEQKNNDVAATITIMQNDIKANETTFNSTKLAQWETFGLNTTQMAPLTAGVGSGWYNPYLCI